MAALQPSRIEVPFRRCGWRSEEEERGWVDTGWKTTLEMRLSLLRLVFVCDTWFVYLLVGSLDGLGGSGRGGRTYLSCRSFVEAGMLVVGCLDGIDLKMLDKLVQRA